VVIESMTVYVCCVHVPVQASSLTFVLDCSAEERWVAFNRSATCAWYSSVGDVYNF